MSQRTVVISDIHLGAIPPDRETAFLSFLHRVGDLADDLLINGDLFDFWYEYGQVIPRGQLPVLSALHELKRSGMTIRFLGGNHDAWAGSFLADEVGLEVIDDPAEIRVGGRLALVAHGDGLGAGDRRYRALRRTLRSAPVRWAFRVIHPDLGIPLARRASRTEMRARDGGPNTSPRSDELERHARALLSDRPDLDLVIFGHTHDPRLVEVEDGRFYLNSGDWTNHSSYTVVTPEEIELVEEAAIT
ncbi:MAG: UDP-2,3-diacylglucosamine diphosphatase [Gemmatimonadota bacterium]|nr:UDP-2,3-diacylglucosamine diphosphatase [Gemmatimonadota bacterium]